MLKLENQQLLEIVLGPRHFLLLQIMRNMINLSISYLKPTITNNIISVVLITPTNHRDECTIIHRLPIENHVQRILKCRSHTPYITNWRSMPHLLSKNMLHKNMDHRFKGITIDGARGRNISILLKKRVLLERQLWAALHMRFFVLGRIYNLHIFFQKKLGTGG